MMLMTGGCDLWTMLQERQEDEETIKTNYPLDDEDEENLLGRSGRMPQASFYFVLPLVIYYHLRAIIMH